jgi:hypothetical protein
VEVISGDEAIKMYKKGLAVFLFLLLALPALSLADEKEKGWKNYSDITGYVGGGIIHREYVNGGIPTSGMNWHGEFSFRAEYEKSLTRTLSVVISAGYSSRAIRYGDLSSTAWSELWESGQISYNWEEDKYEPGYTVSTPEGNGFVFDVGMKVYAYRAPDDKLAFFLYAAAFGVYYERARFNYILDTGVKEEYSVSNTFRNYPFTDLGLGAKFSLKNDLYLTTFLRSDGMFKMFNLYLGLSYRF